jgi:FKBP-type peptidyl-prolyl cis-trans isomerase
MNYKLFAFIAFLCSVAFVSCTTDNNMYGIDEDWRRHNEQIVLETAAKTGEFSRQESLSRNGSVYWKFVDDFIPDTKSGLLTKITEAGTPYFTDSVTVRYTGWFILRDGTKFTFDSTEGANNGISRTFAVGENVDGFATMLQYMTVGEQVEVCIPQQLGYGAFVKGNIPAYTTLWFRIKLLNIIPGNPGEWDK